MAQLALKDIKYKYRALAADAIIAKAQRSLFDSISRTVKLNDNNEPIDKIENKWVNDSFATVALYGIAIQLMGRGDPNIYTILNWKILAELSIGQYEDAYNDSLHALEIANTNKDNLDTDATVNLISSRIDDLKGKVNRVILLKDDTISMDDPYYCVVGRDICRKLVNKKIKDAYGSFSEELKSKISLGETKRALISMLKRVSDCDDYDIDLLSVNEAWPEKNEKDLAWLYFSISGNIGNEAISMVISSADHVRRVVSEIEFGRP